ncbi:MAG: 1-deoxy-D-xylulose-5-phosphate synthase [Planctomycetes bacterium]|nr:1-deoxy-D-xylulose-5-phosphate synthase [Planctomycetota bacterium]
MGILQRINDPADLRALPVEDLPVVAAEIRELICTTLAKNGGHLASGLGVVELTIALHCVFDFLHDRLIFDVSHQCYPHKILTGRRDSFHTIRQRHGLAGYTNPAESPYDLFHFAHAGTAISTALGMAAAEDPDKDNGRKFVAVVGDASIATGVAFEALNHGGELQKDVLVILNDNEMSISKSVGAFSEYLSRVRAGSFYNELKETAHRFIQAIPMVGERIDHDLVDARDAVLSAIKPGYFFEALGPRYFGPVNGHDLKHLIAILSDMKRQKGFRLLHVITEKGHGHPDAIKDPIKWHGVSPKLAPSVPAPQEYVRQGTRNWSDVFADVAIARGQRDEALEVITAAMPDNTAVTRFKKVFPKRTYDVGICEQHAVAFAAGLAKAGKKPVCAIFSTFLQRAFDQVFHEVSLNNLPVVFCVDRAGVVGPDGATHNGSYDIAYMRTFPNIMVMAPRDASEFAAMFDLALDCGQAAAIRYPRAAAPDLAQEYPVRREMLAGLSETLCTGADAAVFALGHMVYPAMEAAEILAREGIHITVVNARFVRPMDTKTLGELCTRYQHVFTLEEHTIRGGFAAAALEECAMLGYGAERIRPIALPDALVPHGTRAELLVELRLDPTGIAQRIRETLLSKVAR